MSTSITKILETIESEMDLGINVSSKFVWKEQINSALNIENRVLGMLKRTFVSRTTYLWKKIVHIHDKTKCKFGTQDY